MFCSLWYLLFVIANMYFPLDYQHACMLQQDDSASAV
jgi:hypothetical protein